MRIARRRIVGLVIIAAGTPGTLLARQGVASAAPGWSLLHRTTVDSGDGRRGVRSQVRIRLSGTHYRLDPLDVPGASDCFKPPTMIFDDRTMMTLDDARKRVAVVSTANLTAVTQQLARLSIDIDPAPLQDLGPGDTILGHPTRHYRTVFSGTMHVLPVRSQPGRDIMSHGIREYWIATDIDLNAEMSVAGSFARAFEAAVLTPPQTRTPLPNGVVLRRMTLGTTGSPGQRPVEVTQTDDVIELRHEPIDPSVFMPPAGYTREDAAVARATSDADAKALRDSISDVVRASFAAKSRSEADSLDVITQRLIERQEAARGTFAPRCAPRLRAPGTKKP